MQESNVTEVSLEEVAQMVDNDLMNAIGELCEKHNASVGTVHFTMAYMIAAEIGEQGDPKEIAVGVLSIQQYIYTIATNIYRHKRKAGAH